MKSVYRTVLMALFIALGSLTLLGACGGGDSESGGGGVGEAGDGSGGGDSDTNDAPDEPTQLAAECSKNPAGSVQPGQNATATYTFNQSFDGTARITPACLGAFFPPTTINIEDGQGSETVQVLDGCAGQILIMPMNVDGIDVSAECSWNVPEAFLDLMFIPDL